MKTLTIGPKPSFRLQPLSQLAEEHAAAAAQAEAEAKAEAAEAAQQAKQAETEEEKQAAEEAAGNVYPCSNITVRLTTSEVVFMCVSCP